MTEIISIEEAREVLGDEANGMSDDSLLELIAHFENIARLVIRNFKVLKDGMNSSLNLV